ncbi:sin3b-related [Anaeramoeba flamelloides]|uniref:Sin3b-related n=1 Tax=Anaeramoeba flamelloides TaxID=1746091 RepID=A0AAV7ZJQ1_9EUKA|nr:sin3b-related [Anaeramoeba flamelloides]
MSQPTTPLSNVPYIYPNPYVYSLPNQQPQFYYPPQRQPQAQNLTTFPSDQIYNTQQYPNYGVQPFPQNVSNTSENERISEALDYIDEVKKRFKDNTEIYENFLSLMKDFKQEKIATKIVFQKVKDLFQGHKDLISKFKQFLPLNFQKEYSQKQNENSPIDYVTQIKERFDNHSEIYCSFLSTLMKYKNGQLTLENICDKVSDLFTDHEDLLKGFLQFLPDTHSFVYANGRLQKKKPNQKPQQQQQQQQQQPYQFIPNMNNNFQFPIMNDLDPRLYFMNQQNYWNQYYSDIFKKQQLFQQQQQQQQQQQPQKPQQQPQQQPQQFQQQFQQFQLYQQQQQQFQQYQQFQTANGFKYPYPVLYYPNSQPISPELINYYQNNQFPQNLNPNNKNYKNYLNISKEKEVNNETLFYELQNEISQKKYFQILKILNLFNQNLLNNSETILLLENFLQKSKFLIPLKKIINSNCPQKKKMKFNKLDWNQRKRSGVSYCSVSKQEMEINKEKENKIKMKMDTNMGMDIDKDMEKKQNQDQKKSVLNSEWISIAPIKKSIIDNKKYQNKYEKNQLILDEQQYELDNLIGNYKRSFQILEKLVKKIKTFKNNNELNQLNYRGLFTDKLFLNTIITLYGDRSFIIFNGLKANPLVTIHILYYRFQIKLNNLDEMKKNSLFLFTNSFEKNLQNYLNFQKQKYQELNKKTLEKKYFLNQINYLNESKNHSQIIGFEKNMDGISILFHITKLLITTSFNSEKLTTIQDNNNIDNKGNIDNNSNNKKNTKIPTTILPELRLIIKNFLYNFFSNWKLEFNNVIINGENKTMKIKEKLFYGNDNFYILFRLYLLLNKKLRKSKKLLQKKLQLLRTQEEQNLKKIKTEKNNLMEEKQELKRKRNNNHNDNNNDNKNDNNNNNNDNNNNTHNNNNNNNNNNNKHNNGDGDNLKFKNNYYLKYFKNNLICSLIQKYQTNNFRKVDFFIIFIDCLNSYLLSKIDQNDYFQICEEFFGDYSFHFTKLDKIIGSIIQIIIEIIQDRESKQLISLFEFEQNKKKKITDYQYLFDLKFSFLKPKNLYRIIFSEKLINLNNVNTNNSRKRKRKRKRNTIIEDENEHGNGNEKDNDGHHENVNRNSNNAFNQKNNKIKVSPSVNNSKSNFNLIKQKKFHFSIELVDKKEIEYFDKEYEKHLNKKTKYLQRVIESFSPIIQNKSTFIKKNQLFLLRNRKHWIIEKEKKTILFQKQPKKKIEDVISYLINMKTTDQIKKIKNKINFEFENKELITNNSGKLNIQFAIEQDLKKKFDQKKLNEKIEQPTIINKGIDTQHEQKEEEDGERMEIDTEKNNVNLKQQQQQQQKENLEIQEEEEGEGEVEDKQPDKEEQKKETTKKKKYHDKEEIIEFTLPTNKIPLTNNLPESESENVKVKDENIRNENKEVNLNKKIENGFSGKKEENKIKQANNNKKLENEKVFVQKNENIKEEKNAKNEKIKETEMQIEEEENDSNKMIRSNDNKIVSENIENNNAIEINNNSSKKEFENGKQNNFLEKTNWREELNKLEQYAIKNVKIRNCLGIKFDVNSHRLIFAENTEDFFHRIRPSKIISSAWRDLMSNKN